MSLLDIIVYFFLVFQTFTSGSTLEDGSFETALVTFGWFGLFAFVLLTFSPAMEILRRTSSPTRYVHLVFFFCLLNVLLGLVAREWRLSSKDMNRMVHALNGNIFMRGFFLTCLILVCITVPLFIAELLLGGRFSAACKAAFDSPRWVFGLIYKFVFKSRFSLIFGGLLFFISPPLFVFSVLAVAVYEFLESLRPKLLAWFDNPRSVRPLQKVKQGLGLTWKGVTVGWSFAVEVTAAGRRLVKRPVIVEAHDCVAPCTFQGCSNVVPAFDADQIGQSGED